MDIYEKFHTYKCNNTTNILNEQHIKSNKLFDLLLDIMRQVYNGNIGTNMIL
jgi:hypothetical protein